MKKQICNKLQFFLKGLEQRLKDNEDFFQEIIINFKSGAKIFPARLQYAGPEKLKYSFQGASKVISFTDLSQEVAKEAENFDELILTFVERGTRILVEADNKDVRIKYEDAAQKEPESSHYQTTAQVGNREYYIKVGQADELLKAIGIMTKDGKIKNDMIRKYNQIDHFVELIDGMLKELGDKDGPINILDCGCGKSYLTFVLNFYLKNILKKDCYFIGLDYSKGVIETSREIARKLGYRNMDFYQTDIKNFKPNRPIDLVISLHACDTATDEALALAIKSKAKAIVAVPCCHRELLDQYSFDLLVPIIKHGIFKTRLADLLTDGLRSLYLEAKGYKTSVVEYISPLETPKNLMIRAVKTREVNPKALKEYQRLKQFLKVNPAIERFTETVS
ncbi:SAM-dependent methyltransferase [Anoxybacter fermentans]|uniref:SAM-dependent methyltransferase n=1 Tax=Anoxybacter fermentans TaxID=1323375 RepID=A0A3Q9HRN6_9FIRM|nr:SAM-dependent methyltransferase [Anoxybacter fermentans]AZR74199.1 SAM-dependent methyltransferase [Anoxybacter fermentans]